MYARTVTRETRITAAVCGSTTMATITQRRFTAAITVAATVMVAATRQGSRWASVAFGMATRTIAVVVMVIAAMATTIVAVNGGDGMMVGARRTIVVMTGVAAATAATAGTVTDGGLTATGQ